MYGEILQQIINLKKSELNYKNENNNLSKTIKEYKEKCIYKYFIDNNSKEAIASIMNQLSNKTKKTEELNKTINEYSLYKDENEKLENEVKKLNNQIVYNLYYLERI